MVDRTLPRLRGPPLLLSPPMEACGECEDWRLCCKCGGASRLLELRRERVPVWRACCGDGSDKCGGDASARSGSWICGLEARRSVEVCGTGSIIRMLGLAVTTALVRCVRCVNKNAVLYDVPSIRGIQLHVRNIRKKWHASTTGWRDWGGRNGVNHVMLVPSAWRTPLLGARSGSSNTPKILLV